MKYKYKNEQTNPYLTHVVTEAGVCNILSALNKQHLCDTQDSHFHISETKDFLVHCEVFWLLTHLSHTDVDTRIDTAKYIHIFLGHSGKSNYRLTPSDRIKSSVKNENILLEFTSFSLW